MTRQMMDLVGLQCPPSGVTGPVELQLRPLNGDGLVSVSISQEDFDRWYLEWIAAGTPLKLMVRTGASGRPTLAGWPAKPADAEAPRRSRYR